MSYKVTTKMVKGNAISPALLEGTPDEIVRLMNRCELFKYNPSLRTCKWCKKEIESKNIRAEYCSANCRVAMSKRKRRVTIRMIADAYHLDPQDVGLLVEYFGLPTINSLMEARGWYWEDHLRMWRLLW